uniref:Uncharacterized protein n=1 Tax=Octopus bimaculoides TaxID=37653 RepID=A0A0L8H9V9_OCTBM
MLNNVKSLCKTEPTIYLSITLYLSKYKHKHTHTHTHTLTHLYTIKYNLTETQLCFFIVER